MEIKLGKLAMVTAMIAVTILVISMETSAETEISQIISKIKQASNDIESYKTNYTIQIDKNGEKVKSIGHIEFKEPNKFYMEVELPELKGAKQIFISNGEVMWQYMPNTKTARKIVLQKGKGKLSQEYFNKRGDIRNPFGNMKSESIKFIKQFTEEDKLIYVLKAEPKDEVKQDSIVEVSKAKIWIFAGIGIPKKVIWYDEKNNPVITQEFKEIKINPDIDENKFNFSPPQGVDILELTE